jgi:hypothetical protein
MAPKRHADDDTEAKDGHATKRLRAAADQDAKEAKDGKEAKEDGKEAKDDGKEAKVAGGLTIQSERMTQALAIVGKMSAPTDCFLKVKDTQIAAHKAILQLKSEHWRDFKFDGDQKVLPVPLKSSLKLESKIALKELTEDDVAEFIIAIYSPTVKVTRENVRSLAKAQLFMECQVIQACVSSAFSLLIENDDDDEDDAVAAAADPTRIWPRAHGAKAEAKGALDLLTFLDAHRLHAAVVNDGAVAFVYPLYFYGRLFGDEECELLLNTKDNQLTATAWACLAKNLAKELAERNK